MRTEAVVFSLVIATYFPFCAPAVRPTAAPEKAAQEMAELWQEPAHLESADLYDGPWGAEHAPDARAVYTFVQAKTHGVSPGLTVRDPGGVKWSVKQGEEGPIEVTLSRVLSAIGYHQPPVYYLPSFDVDRHTWIERAPGGRFRPADPSLHEDGVWSWQQNPFVGTRPYQGLLVVLKVFNSSDLKNSNNTLYRVKGGREGATRWFVVRDLGTALGETGRLDPRRSDPDLFARDPFVAGVRDGFVAFSYHGWHQELFRNRITAADVAWACDLLARLSDPQWADAFRAGGFRPDQADRFIGTIKRRIREGQRLADSRGARAAATARPGMMLSSPVQEAR
jgi:hypothetical protein